MLSKENQLSFVKLLDKLAFYFVDTKEAYVDVNSKYNFITLI